MSTRSRCLLRVANCLLRRRIFECQKYTSYFSTNKNALVNSLPDLSTFDPSLIRNFCIIAHVDHGKSTLADRLLEITGTIDPNAKNEQVLDTLEVERERGITIKAQTSSMVYKSARTGLTYLLNLIDTPGHVDFSYEVSRSLAASDGALFVVDASQGVQAQTVANFWMAFEMNSVLIPVLNKIDMPAARQAADEVARNMDTLFDMKPSDCLRVSARQGTGIQDVLETVIEKVPSPVSDNAKPLRALIFDSWHDKYRGCYLVVLVKDGHLKRGQQIVAMHSGKQYEVQEVGVLHPGPVAVPALYAGQVGYVTANIRLPKEARIGDTLCLKSDFGNVEALPGFPQTKPMMFSGLYPVDAADYDELKSAVAKLILTDPSVTLEHENSAALGAGWRMGFLGVLHMEVFSQRLEKEFDASTIMTAPSVPYKAELKNNEGIRRRYDGKAEITIIEPSKFPDPADVETFLEPMTICTVITPLQYADQVRNMAERRRGWLNSQSMIDENRIIYKFDVPLAEVVMDLVGDLKNVTSGYGSFDYEVSGFQKANLCKVTITINGRQIDEFSRVVLEFQARNCGSDICKKLQQIIPRQQYDIDIKATIGKKVIAQAKVKNRCL